MRNIIRCSDLLRSDALNHVVDDPADHVLLLHVLLKVLYFNVVILEANQVGDQKIDL